MIEGVEPEEEVRQDGGCMKSTCKFFFFKL
jgi:hypothetical protein